ncbi:Crp/Fnr family transcriptional regulator [Defluviimonas sp. D31]|uniref:Crp/Fnr family transcriptional regulator n=1 Tax=Defluviimonas sp. D31 TaxID=3083253 RepID=UPI00296E87C8|nr:Crp/Fnr family transcriptional regulator [Defluviimonas sp. D31]MDW4551463.1 Crp/Fnr family transcriptional regulator [Defluviimonas sp. D31]
MAVVESKMAVAKNVLRVSMNFIGRPFGGDVSRASGKKNQVCNRASLAFSGLPMVLIGILYWSMTNKISDEDFAATGWLSTLPDPVRGSVLEKARWRTFGPGDTVYASGAAGNTLWGIGSGTIKMYISAGEEHMRFCHAVGPGYWFGELELLLDLPRVIEMRTAGNARLLCLQEQDLNKIAEEYPALWRAVARLAATNEALAIAAVDDLMLRDPRKRLAATLLRLSGLRWDFQGKRDLPVVPVTLVELAEVANLSRSVAAKLVAEFVAEGMVAKEYGRLRIDRPDRLELVLQS